MNQAFPILERGDADGVLQVAEGADADTLFALIVEFYRHFDYPFEVTAKRRLLEELLGDSTSGKFWLVRAANGDLAGYVFLAWCFSFEYGGRTAVVDELYVRPEHRGQGLGERVLRALSDIASALGLVELQVEVERGNPRAAALYRREGFAARDREVLNKLLNVAAAP